ncbi:MAG: phytochelatin synthase family protein [Candidatus Woesearchaeota archaeon]
MEIKHTYKHLVRKPCCCGAASLQMILFRREHWVEQEEIAAKIRTKISSQRIKFFNQEFVVDDSDAGIPLERFAEINDLLKQYSLQAEVFKINDINDLKGLITKNLERDNDIIINFHRLAYLPDRNWGHFSSISAINDDQLTICDPSYHSQAYWNTSISELELAMNDKWDGKERGVVIISKI